MRKLIHIQYFALMREQRGLSEETIESQAVTSRDLYEELRQKHHFTLSPDLVRVSINNEFKNWDTKLGSGDRVVFIPPVSGG